ncbi:MAG: peptidase domain-containing ABC transporter [Peptoniphilaceae bacterium]|nr:peptidase domain-containing ABC transporter [Peptoniphilaceae bacterium]
MRVRVPYVEQMSSSECGITCVAMILRYYKSYVSLQLLREYLDTGRDGSSIGQLVDLCSKFQLSTQVSKTPIDKLKECYFPLIAYCNESHFVIIERIHGNYVYIVDPNDGFIKKTMDDFNYIYSDYIIEVYPNKNFKRIKKKNFVFSDLCKIMKERYYLFFTIFSISIVIYFLSLSIPIMMKTIIDSIDLRTSSNTKIYSYILLIGIVITSLFSYIQNILLINYRTFMDFRVSSEIIKKILSVSYHFFEIRRKSDLLMTINSGYIIREIIAQQLIQGIIDMGAIIFMIVYMFKQSVSICIVSISLFIINAFYLAWSRPRIINENRQLVNKRSEVEGQQVEIIYSMLGIKMAGIENYVYDNWKQKQDSYLDMQKGIERIKNKLTSVSVLISKVSPFIIFSISLGLHSSGKITLGDIMAFYSLSSTFFNLAASVSNVYNSYINSGVYLERVHEILSFEENKINQEKNNITCINGEIELKDVSFSYSKHSSRVLSNINLIVKPGQKIAIVGMSGSGKSTLGKIMMGLYTPSEGSVFIDGSDIQSYESSNLRKQIGIVPQDMTLFNRSIAYNIGLGREDISLDEIIESAKRAMIHDEIMAMPLGYNTVISELGMNLSGGQRQRIALARAIVKRPRLLILDEATSALDSFNESKIFEYFKSEKCTQIIIAHRLSTIIDSDLIVVMDNGRIVDIGNHDKLYTYSEAYKKIYNTSATDVIKN